MEYSIDYLVLAFWLIIFAIVFGICGIIEERRNNGLTRKVHGRVPCKVRRRYGSRVRYV